MDWHFVDYVSFYNRLKRYNRKQFRGNNTGDEGNRIYRIQAEYDIREDELVDSIMFWAEEDGFPAVIFGDDKYYVSSTDDFDQTILYESGTRLIIEVENTDGEIYYCDRIAEVINPNRVLRPTYDYFVAEAKQTEEIQNALPELIANADYIRVDVIESNRPQDDPTAGKEFLPENIMFESQFVYVNSGMPLFHFLEKNPEVAAEDIYCAIEDVILEFHKAGYIHGTIDSTCIYIKKEADGTFKAKLANIGQAKQSTDASLQAADIQSLHALWTDTLNQTTELPSKKCRQKRAWTRRRHLVLPFMASRGMTFNNTGRNERRKTRRLRRKRRLSRKNDD
jgi:hypothetical protein